MIETPKKNEVSKNPREKLFLFSFPDNIKLKVRMISAKRKIPMARFIIEAIEINVEKYKELLKSY